MTVSVTRHRCRRWGTALLLAAYRLQNANASTQVLGKEAGGRRRNPSSHLQSNLTLFPSPHLSTSSRAPSAASSPSEPASPRCEGPTEERGDAAGRPAERWPKPNAGTGEVADWPAGPGADAPGSPPAAAAAAADAAAAAAGGGEEAAPRRWGGRYRPLMGAAAAACAPLLAPADPEPPGEAPGARVADSCAPPAPPAPAAAPPPSAAAAAAAGAGDVAAAVGVVASGLIAVAGLTEVGRDAVAAAAAALAATTAGRASVPPMRPYVMRQHSPSTIAPVCGTHARPACKRHATTRQQIVFTPGQRLNIPSRATTCHGSSAAPIQHGPAPGLTHQAQHHTANANAKHPRPPPTPHSPPAPCPSAP